MTIKKILLLSLVLAGFTGIAQVKVGEKAPDIAMANPEGKIIKLSDLKGQVVLIDFWASWCGPCRRENPNVVATYQEFKEAKFTVGKGYAVFSVSLDKYAQQWQQAIKDDKLEWPYHVSDLQFWNNVAAVRYGVQSIPTNFLIDGNGVVIAQGLRGPALKTKLLELKK